MGKTGRVGIVASVVGVGLMVGFAPSAAVAVPPGTVGSFPSYTVAAGAATTGTVDFAPAGLPDATFTTDAGGASAPTGQSAFLGDSTGFGQYFGSSRAQPYLSLGAAAGRARSTTTLGFSAPLPAGAGFAVGDIDADLVEIIALDAAGVQLTGAQLGAQLGAQDTGGTPLLNYCNNSPKPSNCAGSGPFTDAPRWFPTGTTVGGVAYANPVVVGSGSDTLGAYDWFLPTVPVQTLTLRFSVQVGSPSYQLWVAAPAPEVIISGSIEQPDGTPPPAGVEVILGDAAGAPVLDIVGEPVATAVEPDGTFEILTELNAYELSFVVPAGFTPIDLVLVQPEPGETATDIGTVQLAPTAVPVDPPVDPPLPPGDPAPADGRQLAATGSDDSALATSGGLILALGVVLLAVDRRRSRRRTADPV